MTTEVEPIERSIAGSLVQLRSWFGPGSLGPSGPSELPGRMNKHNSTGQMGPSYGNTDERCL